MTRPDMDAIRAWAGSEAAWCHKQQIPDHWGLRHVRTLLDRVGELEGALREAMPYMLRTAHLTPSTAEFEEANKLWERARALLPDKEDET